MSKSPPAYAIGEWTSADGLTLRYRDHAGPADRPAIVCIPALTRNCRDFEPLAADLAGDWRVICADLRGRGMSDYAKDASSYQPSQYAADMLALLDHLELSRVVLVGTSLGGIVIMLLAMRAPERIAAAVLNDVGPEIEAAGLARIREYVGQGRSFPTWMHAARGLRGQASVAYPDYELADWLRLAKRLMAVGPGGRIAFDYDMKIAEPFHAPPGAATGPDMWSAFARLGQRPLLALRGELSDILSSTTLDRMKREAAGMEAVTIARTGHAPTLEEPVAREVINRFLAKVT